MIKVILLIIIVLAFITINIYYQNKIETIKHQLRVLNLKSTSISQTIYPQEIKAFFSVPESVMGIINDDVDLLIAPLKESSKLRTTDVKMEVKILDKASIDTEIWYYVSLPINQTYNSRGWVNKKDFTIIYSQSNDLTY